jgi:hypothetical protein
MIPLTLDEISGILTHPRTKLCLDCNCLHSANSCPICASEAFAFTSNWKSYKWLDEDFCPIVNPPYHVPSSVDLIHLCELKDQAKRWVQLVKGFETVFKSKVKSIDITDKVLSVLRKN